MVSLVIPKVCSFSKKYNPGIWLLQIVYNLNDISILVGSGIGHKIYWRMQTKLEWENQRLLNSIAYWRSFL